MSNPYDDPNFSYDDSPDLYLFTSLTAGSSHIITATSRLETILKANRIPFHAIDCATDEKARRIWTRRAQGKKLPGLVREGVVLGDLETVEEWNEYGEIKDHLGGPPLPKKQTRTPAQDTVGGGNMSAQPLPIRTKEASSETTTTAAQTLQSSQAALLAQQAAAAGKARANKAPTPGVDASKVRALADSEADPETVESTEKNASPPGDKEQSPQEVAVATDEAPVARNSTTSPEAENAEMSLGSPPTSTAIIAHGAISAAQRVVPPSTEEVKGALAPEHVKIETTDEIKKQVEKESGVDNAVDADELSKELAAADAEASAAGPASTSGVDATTTEDAPKAAEPGKTSVQQKVSFAPDATREDAEKREPRKAFEAEAAASKKEHAAEKEQKDGTEKEDKDTAEKEVKDTTEKESKDTTEEKQTEEEKPEDAKETTAGVSATDPDAAGDSVED